MKKGRPKDINTKKGRSHCLLLSGKSELILRKIRKQRPDFNLSRYITEHLVNDFINNVGMKESYIRFRVVTIQREVDEKWDEIDKLKEEINKNTTLREIQKDG